MDFTSVSGSATQFSAFLSRPGGMSERIRLFNWADNPLGPVVNWSQSLRSALSICLNSNFPIAIYWGKDLSLLYNDAWSPIPGNKHPWALGRAAKQVWPEIWKEIEPQFAKAFSGEPGGSKDAMLPMIRHGYTEECYFDFTFTPIFSEEGKVEGIFNAVIETTYQVIHERRSRLLQKLSQKLSVANSREDVFKKINNLIKNNPADIPFCFIYTVHEGEEPVLDASTSNANIVKKLPAGELLKTGFTKHIQSIHSYFDQPPPGIWPEPPTEGLLVPLKAGNGSSIGFIFAGLSARRKHDREYQLFMEGFANVISSAIATIQALDDEKKRVESTNTARLKLEKSESALRSANDQMELTFRNVPAAIYLFNKERKIIFINSKAKLSSLGNPDAEGIVGMDLETIHKKTLEIFELRNEAGEIFRMDDGPSMTAFRTGKPCQQIVNFINRKTFEQKWSIVSAAPLLNESGELTMVLLSTIDITFQKQAEEKIKESEQNFRNLTQALPQLVWVTDSQGQQQYVTDRWKEYTGIEPQGMRTWALILHPEDSRSLSKIWVSCLAGGNTYKAEARLRGKTGNYRWFHVHGEPIRNEKNEIIQWVGAFTDIHEQKMAEELLRESEGKLESQVKKRTEELERSNEDLQQFAHVASHDLKEPIRKIKIFSDLLEEEINPGADDKTKLYLSKIQSATNRMLLMMEGVLRYAGLDGYEQEIERVNTNEIITAVITDLETVIQKRNAEINCDVLPDIPGYAILIYQLFYNLISNALKFSRTDILPLIQIRYVEVMIGERPFAQFIIKDNGIGFEPENAEWIFHTFSRLNAKEDYEGTGLGLALCKKIVGRHRGFLSAFGEPGKGAAFTVQLPLKDDR
jgi:PAS domain S-box-containing protein